MGEVTGIEWTDKTWNPWHGCHKISPGCKFCYMFRDKARYGQDPNVVVRSKTKFTDPLKWPKEPAMCFTCSWSDWLIEEADPWRDEAYDVIRKTPWITYQILTKRIDRAVGRVPNPPLPNIWLGVSVENQQCADERLPKLLETPAAVRFVSYEPALGPVDFADDWLLPRCPECRQCYQRGWSDCPTPNCDGRPKRSGIDWIIVGGESGTNARPFDVRWARNTIAQCKAASVPCFVKQMGAKPFDNNLAWATCSHCGWVGFNAELPRDPTHLCGADQCPECGTPGCITCCYASLRDAESRERVGQGSTDLNLKDKKGGDMSEWSVDLRVRQFPEVAR